MRSEQEMVQLLIEMAKRDERIRMVCMNGSRANLNAPKDPFQDYDIVYFVTDMNAFIEDCDWIDVFGERIMMQTPETSVLYPSEKGGRFPYLMLFTDGNRIDLTLAPLDDRHGYLKEDSLTTLLLDKDDIISSFPAPSDRDYLVKIPSAALFADCWNEFWWVSTYVAKGLWRQEILYAIDHLMIIRNTLLKMMEWKVGIETDFSISVGKNSKYLERFVDSTEWEQLLSTYKTDNYESSWTSLFTMIGLFQETALFVAQKLNYEYRFQEEKKVLQHLQHVKNLPSSATEIY
ncbi:aminoglycoside 6-adenylyltransferase [Niallia sp. 03133]|uniref:aminoglycoside 6-adenylyltransferase n=1 Tax=Niallia sp. 03133 TaxID=3458060 RepID=UPI004044D62F